MPFKGFTSPKRRLSPLLTLDERRGLAEAMFRDVIAAARAARGYRHLVVVSRDSGTLQIAAELGAQPLIEGDRPGYRAAAAQAALAARSAGASALLVLPADLPLVTSHDLELLLQESAGASVALVASRCGNGTNALLTRPPGVIPYRFGAGSYHAHLQSAERRSLAVADLHLDNLSLDLDEPDDLRALLCEQPAMDTAAWRFLTQIQVADRLSLHSMVGSPL